MLDCKKGKATLPTLGISQAVGHIDLDRVALQLTQYLPAASGPMAWISSGKPASPGCMPCHLGSVVTLGNGHMVQSEPMSYEPGPTVGRKGHSLFQLELDFVVFSLEPWEAPCCPRSRGKGPKEEMENR